MKTVFAIVGESGSGKTALALEAAARGVMPTVASYTTRPMRPGEADGREHRFAAPGDMPAPGEMLAHTVFGGFDYWVTAAQMEEMPGRFTYVVDEDGLGELEETLRGRLGWALVKVRVRRALPAADPARAARDEGRFRLPDSAYDAVIVNDGTVGDLCAKLARIAEAAEKKPAPAQTNPPGADIIS